MSEAHDLLADLPPSTLTPAETMAAVLSVIDDVRPVLQRDGGDIALDSIDGDRIRVRLTGACLSCALAGQTLGMIRRRMVDFLGRPVMVVPVTD